MPEYIINKHMFFNWYFKNIPKEQISAFISPYFLALANKDAHFSLNDILQSIESVPTSLIVNYPGKERLLPIKQVRLSK